MNKFRFWMALVLALILGLTGYFLSNILPPLSNYSPFQTRIFYSFLGVFLGMLTYARISSWIVRTLTTLARKLTINLASEIINQFSNLTSRKPFFPNSENIDVEQVLKGNLEDFEGVILLDTSSIIDGRVLDIAKTGFLSGLVLIPGFILRELQQVADSADPIKRFRGRFGFEIINQLKRIKHLTVQVWNEQSNILSKRAGSKVDDKLIYLGKITKGKILTGDFNLSKVAKLSGVEVLNLNELANALKTLPLPGEKLTVKVLHSGTDKDQGVGYLPDGVMVVIKDGADLIGKELKIEATKIIQGPAGRMVFGKRAE